MEFSVGDRVILTTDGYGRSEINPCWGSMYECAGTVEKILKVGDSLIPIRVQWDNGYFNSYNHSDLTPFGAEEIKDDNPNFTFKRIVER